jgi:quercetin dioxygenase-like cupin family protein
MRLAPGASDEMHSHPAEAVLFLNEGTVRVTLEDGTVIDKDIAAGEVMWSPAWTHRVENVGKSEVHAIIVELKDGAADQSVSAPEADDPALVSPAHYVVTTENDRVRIVDLRFGPGDRDEMHGHPSYVAYFITGADLAFAFADGRTGARQFEPGEVIFSQPTVHMVENAGSEPAHIWIVELKDR